MVTRRTAAPPPPHSDWAYFFDLDGTLIEFADTPAAVRVGDHVRQLLERLHSETHGAVVVVQHTDFGSHLLGLRTLRRR